MLSGWAVQVQDPNKIKFLNLSLFQCFKIEFQNLLAGLYIAHDRHGGLLLQYVGQEAAGCNSSRSRVGDPCHLPLHRGHALWSHPCQSHALLLQWKSLL